MNLTAGHNRWMQRGVLGLLLALTTVSCQKETVETKRGLTERVAGAATATSDKAVTRFDPNATGETQLKAPAGSLKGASVSMQPGSLSVSVDMVVEESVSLGDTSLLSDLNVDASLNAAPVGKGLIVRPAQSVDLSGQLSISLPINGGIGLLPVNDHSLSLTSEKIYAVIYKQYHGNTLLDGIIPTKDLRMSADKVTFDGYFGSYWLIEVKTAIAERKEVAAQEPIVNVQKIAVVETSGIVDEKVILAKAAKPPVQWIAPVLKFDSNSRVAELTASLTVSETLADCKADFYSSISDSGGIVVSTGDRLSANLNVVADKGRRLIGRFRCHDSEGRLTLSPWSEVIDIPAPPAPVVAKPTFDGKNFAALRTQMQSRAYLRLKLTADLLTAYPTFQLFNATADSLLLDLFTTVGEASEAHIGQEALTDGSGRLGLALSPLISMGSLRHGANTLRLREAGALKIVDLTITIRDFAIFDGQGIASSSQPAATRLQAWTSVLAQPVVQGGANTSRLSTGLLSIVNP